MNADEREQLRLSLLRFLDACPSRYGLNLAYLHQKARAEGRSWLEPAGVTAELDYLADKEFVAEILKGISPENRSWRITADGRDLYAQLSAS